MVFFKDFFSISEHHTLLNEIYAGILECLNVFTVGDLWLWSASEVEK